MLADPANRQASGQWRTIGNPSAIAFLSGAIDQQRVSHAYLFVGPNRVGKHTLAIDFARALNCNAQDIVADGWAELRPEVPCGQCSSCDRIARHNHADVRTITSSTQTSKDADTKAGQRRTMIGIDLIKDLQSDAMLEPYEGRKKIFILDEANRMSPDAANALLKTLEEPPDKVHIVLTATSTDLLPETISSRCHLVKMRSVSTDVISEGLIERFDIDEDEAQSLAKMSMGAPGWAIAALGDPAMLDARNQSAARIIELFSADLVERFDYAAQMARQFRNDRATVMEDVARWMELTRDIAMLQNGLRQHIVFDDRIVDLDRLANTLTSDDVALAAAAIQKTRDALMVNASPQLAFDGMMLEMPTPAVN